MPEAPMPVSRYDEISEWYVNWLGTGSLSDDPFFPAVEALMGNIAGQRICDLACGEGRVARYLAAQGAHVLAVDISAKLLEMARGYKGGQPHRIEYRLADAASLEGVADSDLDGVLCHMALMDIPDLQSTLLSIARVLRPGGWFAFSILHPCFNAPGSDEMTSEGRWIRTVNDYFLEGYWRSDTRTGPPGKVGAYHRMLSTYMNAITEASLVLEHMSEPQFVGSHADRRPIWAEVPAALIVKCTKPAPRDGAGTMPPSRSENATGP